MSIEDLANFLHSVDHSLSLRRELKKCTTDDDLLNLANKYGFHVSKDDLDNAEESRKVSQWFENSEIKPFQNQSTK